MTPSEIEFLSHFISEDPNEFGLLNEQDAATAAGDDAGDYTIEPLDSGPIQSTFGDHAHGSLRAEWGVYLHGEYKQSSVLAGQPKRTLIDVFDSIEEAQRRYPNAEVLDTSSAYPSPMMPSEPPDWFDPMDAGEAWGEDDY